MDLEARKFGTEWKLCNVKSGEPVYAVVEDDDGRFRIRHVETGEALMNSKGEAFENAHRKNLYRTMKERAERLAAQAVEKKVEKALGSAGTLSERAVLTEVNIQVWSARKTDQSVTAKVNQQHGAAADAGQFVKRLMRCESQNQILSIAQMARVAHGEMTLPWSKERILSVQHVEDYMMSMDDLQKRFFAAVDALIAEYDDAVTDAQQELGDLFDPADYPSKDEIAERYSFTYEIKPVPDAMDFRAQMSAAQAETLRKRLAETVCEQERLATQDGLRQLMEAVGGLAEQLRGDPGVHEASGRRRAVVHSSKLKALRSKMDRLRAMDISASRTLSQLADSVTELFESDEAEVMREDESARANVASRLEEITNQAAGYV